MPAIENWVNEPLKCIQKLFDEHGCNLYKENVLSFFNGRLEEKGLTASIPSLNVTPLHELKANSVVKMRCMIQDMFDPEFYLEAYQVTDRSSGSTFLRCGRYKDVAECQVGQDIDVDSANNKTSDRQTFYCVPIPGETKWTKEAHSKSQDHHLPVPSTSGSASRQKRSLSIEECGSPDSVYSSSCSTLDGSSQEEGMETESLQQKDTKSLKMKGESQLQSEPDPSRTYPNLNFPLPDETGPACLVKVYEKYDEFKLNDMVEFVGVLSVDPAMASFPDEKGDDLQSSLVNPTTEEMEGIEELNVRCPPPSLVPRLHVIKAVKLHHINPELPLDISAESSTDFVNTFLKDCSHVREELISILTQALFGDSLAAEYLLCHLISSVGISQNSQLPKYFYELLQELVTKTYMLPMTLEFMNKKSFVPRKDYTANRLISGILQLSERTHLVVDETLLKQGQLDATGVKNITALGNVVTWQKAEYDFNFHTQEFPTNIQVLVFSEGKSLLPSDYQVRWQPEGVLDDIWPKYSAINNYLTPALLQKLRMYVSILKIVEYKMTADTQKSIEDDFVETRKEDAKSMSIDDFHSLLVLTRLLSLSHGETTLKPEIWHRAKRMEQERKRRLLAN
ncbi:mini-chromosome maintenance complex-binding protein-like isoform X2 [Tubulanus polymorphus]|uniref:mini-chromosome maintenance complex-binding protein-like isoform X2 n=1 Tax=Tubulanus polymorphus TaxID=672921 RepID=UPI003DA34777